MQDKFLKITDSLADAGVELFVQFDNAKEERQLRTNTGWTITLSRGLDIYQSLDAWQIGSSNPAVRPCMEAKVRVHRIKS